MRRKTLEGYQCPVARTLDKVGEWWSMLILRDAFSGISKFDDFQTSLGIAPNMLTRRLLALVESGFLEKRQYLEKPPRFEYILTARGLDFRPVVLAMVAFGNRQFSPEGRSVIVRNTQTGEEADPQLIDRVSGRPLEDPAFRTEPTSLANEQTRHRFRFSGF